MNSWHLLGKTLDVSFCQKHPNWEQKRRHSQTEPGDNKNSNKQKRHQALSFIILPDFQQKHQSNELRCPTYFAANHPTQIRNLDQRNILTNSGKQYQFFPRNKGVLFSLSDTSSGYVQCRPTNSQNLCESVCSLSVLLQAILLCLLNQ